ncbi:MAG: hypothetical protein GWN53_17145 [Gammaproteobacteria bacterium]|uniref:Uncharacterized protein n=1 Tax=Candidatus Kutchimonas denitrificans TaxID=3056748 RepID=A0AAE5CAQ1_9BACT|nr:hypothetical protein [Candidatus Kutchimonas denitrificans]NIV53568.1 hypothetical protein [Gammaproteobacteria bacterium]
MSDAQLERLAKLHYLERLLAHTAPVLHAQEKPFFDREIGRIIENEVDRQLAEPTEADGEDGDE